jgi:hypothetical protein
MSEVKDRYWKRYELAVALITVRVLKDAEKRQFKDDAELQKFIDSKCKLGYMSLDFLKNSFDAVFAILDNYNIVGAETSLVYDKYKQLCIEMNYEVISRIDFSRFVCKYFGYSVVDKKVNGNKSRIFVYAL